MDPMNTMALALYKNKVPDNDIAFILEISVAAIINSKYKSFGLYCFPSSFWL